MEIQFSYQVSQLTDPLRDCTHRDKHLPPQREKCFISSGLLRNLVVHKATKIFLGMHFLSELGTETVCLNPAQLFLFITFKSMLSWRAKLTFHAADT
jgi:hypothetical protein